MKKLIVIGLLVCGLFGLTSAYGVCPPQWSPGPNSGCPNCSCDPVTLEQMGSFDASGNWVFNSGFHQELSSWLSSTGMPTMNDNDWTPKVFLNWAPNTNFGLPHLQVQYKEVGVATRIYMQLPGIWLGRPEIYRWTYNGNFNAFIVNWAPPPGCVNPGQCSGPPNNNDPNPCCWLWDKPKMIQNSPLEIVQFSDIESIQWYQNGVMKGSLTQADAPGAFRLVNSENQININYDFLNTPPGYNPVRQKYSYWPIPNPIWRIQNFPVVYGTFPPGVVPTPNVPNEFIVRIFETDWQLHFLGGDTSEPPLIPTTAQVIGNEVNKGKVKNKEIAVSAANIMAAEVGGNLVIQWGEAVILEPYWQIRVVVGDKNAVGNDIGAIPGSPLAYAMIEVPYPAGTAVLPADAWSALKSWIALNNDQHIARVTIYYRRMYQNSIQNGGMLQVRSQSNYIKVPF